MKGDKCRSTENALLEMIAEADLLVNLRKTIERSMGEEKIRTMRMRMGD